MTRRWLPDPNLPDDDIEEARRLRAEAIARRELLKKEADSFVQTIVHRRRVDGFGEELQITFRRKTDNT